MSEVDGKLRAQVAERVRAAPSGAAPRAVVLGAGVVGVNVAFALRTLGLHVAVVDPRPPGSATSSGNAGWFATAEIAPLARPELLGAAPAMLFDPLGPLSIRWAHLPGLTPWLWRFFRAANARQVREATAALAALNRRTWEDYEPVIAAAGLDGLVARSGVLYAYERPRAFEAAREEWDRKATLGVGARRLDADEVAAIEPELGRTVCGGYLAPDSGHTRNPQRFVERIADHLRRRGVQFHRAEARAFRFSERGPTAVVLDGGETLPFDLVVVAAGPWSRALCAEVGHAPPLGVERGYNTTIANHGVALRRPVCFVEHAFVVTPMDMGLRIGGAVELAQRDARPNFARAKALVRLAARALPRLRGESGAEWMGSRPSLPDSLPVIGPSPRHPNVVFAFGHGHLGLTQAATTARLVAELVSGKWPSVDLAPFRIDRF